VLDAARRAQALTRQLLQFGRQQDTAPTPQSLAGVIDSTLSLVRSTIDRRIEIRAECEPALPPVRINAVTLDEPFAFRTIDTILGGGRDALIHQPIVE